MKTRTAQHSPVVAALSSMEVDPDWEHALFSENDEVAYIEFPLISERRVGIAPPGTEDPETDIRRSAHRLVIRQDKATGELEMYTSLWVPADEPSEGLMPGLTMLDKSDFSGSIYLFYPDGQFCSGANYQDGQVISSSVITEISQTEATTRAVGTGGGGGCTLDYGGYWEQTCWYNGDGGLIHCTSWELNLEYLTINCIEGDNPGPGPGGGGNNGGGNSGGSTGGGLPPNYRELLLKDQKTILQIQPLLDQLKEDCLGQALIDYLGKEGVSIRYDSSLSSPAVTEIATGNIRWMDSGAIDYIVLEELFHSYQVKSGGFDKNYKGSMEIEAKVAVWKYMDRIGKEFQSDKAAWDMIGKFAQDPTYENYVEAINGIARIGYWSPTYEVNRDLYYTLPNYNKINPC